MKTDNFSRDQLQKLTQNKINIQILEKNYVLSKNNVLSYNTVQDFIYYSKGKKFLKSKV